MNIPNALTVGRIVAGPVAVALHASDQPQAALIVLLAAFLSDFLDGRLARRWGQTTSLGALLDPVADKALALVCYAYIVYVDAVADRLQAWVLILALAVNLRNLAQLLAIPILDWWLRRPFKVVPRWPAKWATAIYFANIPLLLFSAPTLPPTRVALWVTVPLSLLLEAYILATYLPRLVAIARGRHDTFE